MFKQQTINVNLLFNPGMIQLIMTKCPPQIHNLNQYNNRFGECKRMSRKIIWFLHDIVES